MGLGRWKLSCNRLKLQAPADRLPSDETLAELRQNKAALVDYLLERESRLAERRFGQPHARLFPFVGKQVWTPEGKGKLLSVYAETCEVLPEGATRTMRVNTGNVKVIQ